MAAARQISRLPPLPTIRDLVRLYRIRALRQLSQNFLMDERITDKIVRSAGYIRDGFVCEVGPGPGGITRSIVRKAPKEIVVVEKDPRFVPTLELLSEACENYIDMRIEIGDIMSYNLESAFPTAPKLDWLGTPPPVHLIGNLPFSVSTHLIIRWLQFISEKRSAWKHGRTRMTLTFQKEVAERMVAPVMHDQRCRLSVMCQFWCHVNHKFTIPGTAFVPKPDVDVGVVTLTPLKTPLVDLPFKTVEKMIRQVFHMRQKYAVRGAQTLFPEDLRDELGLRMFQLADIDPTTRPFQISNEEFARLCYAYKLICDEHESVASYDYRACKTLKLANVHDSLLD